ncbi:PqqD family protein [Brevibacillus laterosporus]|uniref:PqqD family protein n=1 Tax=Brevibacillus laterosporus TaxID=1465 RepID=A0A2S5HIW4_BRELA|nr:PqqD family protein [Brevibacillus laterosporus]ATO48963.1 hypothetical protein BrL25_07495 [Brevibacillus laterosporus DSM 25]AYB40952.1 PqqD family protein [Brevibacillus laterosporus]MBG9775544.1 hypothetical protein [Brevibacillus laterosporus]MBG9798563.1 hypothetical protein [Brevibacillus laterosporus]MBG9803278.1 hypothetical protein [Brevibacillus laterosporus]
MMSPYQVNKDIFYDQNVEGIFVLTPEGQTILFEDEVACTLWTHICTKETITLEEMLKEISGKFNVNTENTMITNDIQMFLDELVRHRLLTT